MAYPIAQAIWVLANQVGRDCAAEFVHFPSLLAGEDCISLVLRYQLLYSPKRLLLYAIEYSIDIVIDRPPVLVKNASRAPQNHFHADHSDP